LVLVLTLLMLPLLVTRVIARSRKTGAEWK